MNYLPELVLLKRFVFVSSLHWMKFKTIVPNRQSYGTSLIVTDLQSPGLMLKVCLDLDQ